MGCCCPESLGDYLAGPNHTLPTSGTARFSSPLSVDDFIKKTQYTYFTREALAQVADEIAVFARGDVLTLPSGSLTALWPEEGRVRPGMDANLSSMALLAELRGTTLLLTGDLDGRYAPYIATPADILKLAHHGASADTPEDFLAAVNPGLLLVSTGDRNRLAAVEERFGDIPACATASHGALTLTFTGGGYTLTTFK